MTRAQRKLQGIGASQILCGPLSPDRFAATHAGPSLPSWHKLLGFGEAVLAGSEVFNAIRDMLSELMQRLRRSVYLAVRDGEHVVYINRLQGPSADVSW
jgi:hypothetical protein